MTTKVHISLIEKLLEDIANNYSLDFYSDLEDLLSQPEIIGLKGFISQYLFFAYKIDKFHNLTVEQIDQFGFLLGLNLKDGFERLMHELIDLLKNANISDVTNTFEHQNKSIKNLALDYRFPPIDTSSIAPGMKIFLNDKVGDDYKKTKFFDKNLRNPSWDLFYKSELLDFKFVKFSGLHSFTKELTTFERVFRIFSNVCDTVERVERLSSGEINVYTSVFKIDLLSAVAANEVSIINLPLKTNKSLKYLKGMLEIYEGGNSKSPEFLILLSDWIFLHIQSLHPEWVNFQRDENGFWLKVN